MQEVTTSSHVTSFRGAPISPCFFTPWPQTTVMERHRHTRPIWDHDLLRRREKNEKWHPFELRNVHMIQGESEVVGSVLMESTGQLLFKVYIGSTISPGFFHLTKGYAVKGGCTEKLLCWASLSFQMSRTYQTLERRRSGKAFTMLIAP